MDVVFALSNMVSSDVVRCRGGFETRPLCARMTRDGFPNELLNKNEGTKNV
jgi:hypothetical protein